MATGRTALDLAELDVAILRQRLSAYEPRELIACLRFAPRWPDGSFNRAYSHWRERNPRLAAVLLLFLERPDGLRILLTERHAELQHHAGEISLPGGSMNAEDVSLQATARRETAEEVGLFSEDVELWGQLDGVYVPPSNFAITPFTGLILNPANIRPHAPEVQSIIELPLTSLFDPSAASSYTQDSGRLVEYYAHGQHRIWGATARILNNLAEALGLSCDASHGR